VILTDDFRERFGPEAIGQRPRRTVVKTSRLEEIGHEQTLARMGNGE
jgi:hypothetical protein